MEIHDQVYNELTLLQDEHENNLMVAEESLNAVLIFVMNNAPTELHGIQLISHCFNGIINTAVDFERERNL
jgi:hypothetical protein